MKRYCFEPPREGCFEFEDLQWRPDFSVRYARADRHSPQGGSVLMLTRRAATRRPRTKPEARRAATCSSGHMLTRGAEAVGAIRVEMTRVVFTRV